jgi:hypothetical protein
MDGRRGSKSFSTAQYVCVVEYFITRHSWLACQFHFVREFIDYFDHGFTTMFSFRIEENSL